MRITGTSSSGKRGVARIALIAFACTLCAPGARGGDGLFTVLVKGNLTTSSQLFVNPDAADIVARAESLPLTDFFGVGAELRYRIPETNIAVGISADYIRARTTSSLNAFPRITVPVDDGYTVIPVEVTGYFIIPFSSETFGVYMGGGGGLYFGERNYRLGNTDAPSRDGKAGFGIHVLGGVSYRFFGPLEVILEMKFRDLQFDSQNAFSASPVRYNGTSINVGTNPFNSRAQTDGIVFQLALGFSF
ncbi:MAG: hypothetical protein AB1428_10325 [Bacteroidota bacterium]